MSLMRNTAGIAQSLREYRAGNITVEEVNIVLKPHKLEFRDTLKDGEFFMYPIIELDKAIISQGEGYEVS